MDSGSSSDGSGSGRDPTAAVPLAVVNPRAALDTAHKFTKLPGSATACVVQLCPDQKSLIAANLVSRQGFLFRHADATGLVAFEQRMGWSRVLLLRHPDTQLLAPGAVLSSTAALDCAVS
jgi:hypothetical protein